MKITAPLAAAALVGVTLFAAPSVAQAQSNPTIPPISVDVDLVSANGSGCAAGETRPALSVVGNKVTITNRHKDMITAAGNNTPRAESRKFCQYGLKVTAPQGYTYGIEKFALSGSAYIEQGAEAKLDFSSYFQGASETLNRGLPVPGLFAERFTLTGYIERDETQWAPCGAQRNLNVKISTIIDPKTQTADSYSWVRQDEAGGVVFTLALKKC